MATLPGRISDGLSANAWNPRPNPVFDERGARILLEDRDAERSRKRMEFRLIYAGELLGASKTDTRSKHKHEVRRVFHQQLKTLWRVNPNLREWISHDSQMNLKKTHEVLAGKFEVRGVPYVPLDFEGLGVGCRLDILMLRPDQPGQTLIKSGDLDNRLKTVFDALRIPSAGEAAEPQDGESPFYCLLEDDCLINHVALSTDLLLGSDNPNEVRLVITVNLWPISSTMLNMGIF